MSLKFGLCYGVKLFLKELKQHIILNLLCL